MEEILLKYKSPHGPQTERAFSVSDVKIDLSTRAIQEIELSPLEICRNLKIFDISSNQLTSIDLAPLSKVHTLTHLRLSDNRLKTIDLWPLSGLSALMEVDLINNRFDNIDLTPVTQATVIIDRGTTIRLDSVLKYLTDVLELRKRFVTSKGAHPRPPQLSHFEFHSYTALSYNLDWVTIYKRLMAILGKIPEELWFHAHMGLLEGFGFQEIAGFDGDPKLILEGTKDIGTFSEAKEHIYSRIVDLLELQLIRGGPTAFIQIEKIKQTKASRLIPLIVAERKKEFEDTRVYIYGNKVLLKPLWFTAYGVELLQALGMGLITDLEGLEILKEKLNQVQLHIKTEEIDEYIESDRHPISKSIEEFILSVARTMGSKIDLVKREPWTKKT